MGIRDRASGIGMESERNGRTWWCERASACSTIAASTLRSCRPGGRGVWAGCPALPWPHLRAADYGDIAGHASNLFAGSAIPCVGGHQQHALRGPDSCIVAQLRTGTKSYTFSGYDPGTRRINRELEFRRAVAARQHVQMSLGYVRAPWCAPQVPPIPFNQPVTLAVAPESHQWRNVVVRFQRDSHRDAAHIRQTAATPISACPISASTPVRRCRK